MYGSFRLSGGFTFNEVRIIRLTYPTLRVFTLKALVYYVWTEGITIKTARGVSRATHFFFLLSPGFLLGRRGNFAPCHGAMHDDCSAHVAVGLAIQRMRISVTLHPHLCTAIPYPCGRGNKFWPSLENYSHKSKYGSHVYIYIMLKMTSNKYATLSSSSLSWDGPAGGTDH